MRSSPRRGLRSPPRPAGLWPDALLRQQGHQPQGTAAWVFLPPPRPLSRPTCDPIQGSRLRPLLSEATLAITGCVVTSHTSTLASCPSGRPKFPRSPGEAVSRHSPHWICDPVLPQVQAEPWNDICPDKGSLLWIQGETSILQIKPNLFPLEASHHRLNTV